MTLPTLAEVTAGLGALIGREHVSEDYVRFRIGLVKAQDEVRSRLAPPEPSPWATGAGAPPPPAGRLVASDVGLDRVLLRGLLGEVRTLLGSRGPGGEDLARLERDAARDESLLGDLARTAAFDPRSPDLAALARRVTLSDRVLLFVGRVLAAPFVAAAVARRGAHPLGRPTPPGSCPACGSEPGPAKLRRPDGGRVLFCALCGTGWELARAACPFCARSGAVGVLSVDEDDPRWIETCESCGGYVVTVDERRLPPGETVLPLVEATASLYLDLIAEKEGCVRGLPYAALR